jgi:hypothetical protein
MKKVLMICAMGMAIGLLPMFQQDSMAGLNDGLVASYAFNGNATDESGKGHNGTVNGAVLTSDRFGTANSAYSFNGTSDYIDVANATDLNPTTEITITAWFKADSFALGSYSWPALVKKSNDDQTHGYAMEIVQVYESNPCMGFAVDLAGYGWSGTPTYLGTPTLETGVWYFAAGVYNGSTVTLYLGSLGQSGLVTDLVTESHNYSGSITQSSNNLNIGRDPSNIYGSGRFFDGAIDDVRIYGRALSSAEITQVAPEPATMLLLGLGGLFLRKRK